MTDPRGSAAAVAHGLNIESGGGGLERFVYGWCPCGWQYDANTRWGYTSDQVKVAFANHLKGLRDA